MAVNVDEVREFSLSLPDATEEPHFHFNSFRINGKIFATMPPSNDLLHVFVPEEEREVAIMVYPEICEALQWGKRVMGVKVDLTNADRALVEGLLRAAYESKSKARKS
jgi:hypothetical protein